MPTRVMGFSRRSFEGAALATFAPHAQAAEELHSLSSLPCAFSNEGLPYSIQLVGHHFDAKRLCRIGHAYEQETDWHRRHPTV